MDQKNIWDNYGASKKIWVIEKIWDNYGIFIKNAFKCFKIILYSKK